jgi:DNA-binding CsgD family transcriptional regulator
MVVAGRREQAAFQAAIDGAALDSHGWAPLIDLLMLRFDCEGGGLNIIDPRTMAFIEGINIGLTARATADYYRHVVWMDPRMPQMARAAVGSATPDRHWFRDAEMDADPFFAWFSTEGLRHSLFVKLVGDGEQMGALSVIRRAGRGALNDDDVAFAAGLAPQMVQAALVSRRIAALEGIEHALHSAVGAKAQAFALIDQAGGVVHANGSFRTVLERRDGLMMRGRVLTDFVGGVDRAVAAVQDSGQGSAVLVRRRDVAPAYRLVLQPVSPRAAEARGFCWGKDGTVLVFLDDPDAERGATPIAMLQQLFGLTPSEAMVAARIGAGEELETIALGMGVTISTVRTHLKAVFAKMGVSRQLAVALLVRGIPHTG